MSTVLITGASMGLGEDFARQYAASGKNLILVARSEKKLMELAQELASKHSVKVEYLGMDLSAQDSAEKLFEAFRSRGWDVDLLVNNAGFGMMGNLVDQDLAELDRMMMLNMCTLTKLCRLFLPVLIAKKAGGIINVASTAAFQPIPYFACYAATKAYVLSLSEALHAEASPYGVRVFALCPGATETKFFERATSSGKKETKIPMAKSEDVVRYAIRRFDCGAMVGVHGALNKIVATSSAFAPTKLVMKIGSEMMRRADH